MTTSQRTLLESLGVRLNVGAVPPWGGDPDAWFDLVEGESPEVEAVLQQWGFSGSATWTEFTKQEIHAARWCNLRSTWQHGYPQPDELNFGYWQTTYDLSDHCSACGIGMRQKAPFQMKGEPKWGRRAILQLHWVLDEYFVTPELWAGVFEPLGVPCRPVTNTKGIDLRTVVQLVVEGEQVSTTRGSLDPETCPTCGRTKYQYPERGFFPAITRAPARAIVKTAEWFGAGGAAGKCVLASQALVHKLTAVGLRGTSFWPVAPDNDELD